MILRQLAFAAALTGLCMGCCDDTFAQTETLHFINKTTLPVVISDFAKDDIVSHMRIHRMNVRVGQEVTWTVDFPDSNPYNADSSHRLAHGFYRLDVLVRAQIACEWLYTFEQASAIQSYVNSIFNVMMPGFNFEHNDDIDPSVPIDSPRRFVLIEDNATKDFVHKVLHDNY